MKKVPLKSTALNSSKPTWTLREKVWGSDFLQLWSLLTSQFCLHHSLPPHTTQCNACKSFPYRLQGQGHSWLFEPALYPGDAQPSLDHFGMSLWDPGESSETFGSQSHWCPHFQGRCHQCLAHCLGQSHLCKHLHVHHLQDANNFTMTDSEQSDICCLLA